MSAQTWKVVEIVRMTLCLLIVTLFLGLLYSTNCINWIERWQLCESGRDIWASGYCYYFYYRARGLHLLFCV